MEIDVVYVRKLIIAIVIWTHGHRRFFLEPASVAAQSEETKKKGSVRGLQVLHFYICNRCIFVKRVLTRYCDL
uniref:Uncharacterized protein n=1 Tax=Anguilla anguilla TaxID=7936 RepID=A0A0E9SWR7_ANGAN